MRDAPLSDLLQIQINGKPITAFMSRDQIESLAVREVLADLNPKPSILQNTIMEIERLGSLPRSYFSGQREYAIGERKRLRREFLVDLHGRDLDPPARPSYFAKMYANIQAERTTDPLVRFRDGTVAMPLWAELIFTNTRNRKDHDYLISLDYQQMPDGSRYPPGTPLLCGSNLKIRGANAKTPHYPICFTRLNDADRAEREINDTYGHRTDNVFVMFGSRLARAFYLDEGIINPDVRMATTQPGDERSVQALVHEATERAYKQQEYRLNGGKLHPTGVRSWANFV